MDADANPYQSPIATDGEVTELPKSTRQQPVFSLFMIVAGAFFCVASFYSILGGGVDLLMSSYRTMGWFPFAFMVFYGVTGGFISILHLSYLVRGRPRQSLAGVYAIVIGLGVAAVAVVAMQSIV